MTQQQREAMTQETGTSQPAGGPHAAGDTPYPDIADTSHATAAAAAFFRSFFTAKTSKDIEATHAHFHPGKTVYFDATLGWALPSNAGVRNMWEQYRPQWPAGAKSYPTQILGDMTSAVVFVTDTPELFGGEIRTISVVDLEDGTVPCSTTGPSLCWPPPRSTIDPPHSTARRLDRWRSPLVPSIERGRPRIKPTRREQS
jgi:hypothetical protein